MRIAVNTRLLLKDNLDGIGWFTFETMKRIVLDHPDVEFFFLFDRKPHPDFLFADNVKPVVLHPQARHPILYVIFFEWAVPKALKEIKPDLFVSCDGYMSLGTKVPTLDVIHDLNFERYPEHLPPLLSNYYRFFFPKFARKAIRIATVSEYSKRDIIDQYGLSGDKIDVVYNGVNELYTPLAKALVTEVRERFSSGCPYFLFVGSIHPRKNLLNQLRAFFNFRQKSKDTYKFLVVGSDFYGGRHIKRKISDSEFSEDVIFVGRQNPEDLRLLYGGAFALSYVSFFEGFGIPILEAMSSGIPVITSTTTSMPEVGGDAVLTSAPDKIEDISDQMLQLAEREDLRVELIEKGIERSKLFNWDRTARGLWASIEKALKTSSGSAVF